MLPTFYPSLNGQNPIHEVTDWRKVRRIIRDLRKGANIPAIVTTADGCPLNGVHRTAANNLLEMLGSSLSVDVVEIDDVDLSHKCDEAVAELMESIEYCGINYELAQSLLDS